MAVPIANVYQLARAQRLTHAQAVTATAIAMSESGLDSAAVGDESLADSTWGPSVGLWQIRSLRAETGTGGTRDVTRLKDASFNAHSMAVISGYGSSWTPWTMYTNGDYRSHLGAVEAASRGVSGSSSGGGSLPPLPAGTTVGVSQSSSDPLSDPFAGGALTGGATFSSGGIKGSAGVLGALPGVPGLPGAEDVLKGLVLAAGVAVGVTLVAIGAWRAVSGGGGS